MHFLDLEDEIQYIDLSNEEILLHEPLLSTENGKPTDNGKNLQAPQMEDFLSSMPSDSFASPENDRELYERCLVDLSNVFPGISSEYVQGLFDTWNKNSRLFSPVDQQNACHDLSLQILDANSYPRERDRVNDLKRKRSRSLDSDEEARLQWKGNRDAQGEKSYFNAVRWELLAEFPSAPAKVIDRTLRDEGSFYAAYLALKQAEWEFEKAGESSYLRLKNFRKPLNASDRDSPGAETSELVREMRAAREKSKQVGAKRKAEADAAKRESAVEQAYRRTGNIVECQCCFGDFTMNNVTHCDGDPMHFFCLDCAKKNAHNEIGKHKYKLVCMSGDVCAATFSPAERRRFLDEKSLEALERMQFQAEVKEAGLEGLTNCPFCDFAAICSPVEIDKEFRCENPGCRKVSCRLCQRESHIPLSCDEWKKENKISDRHILEEARTAALLKNCPKCNVPILKENGCNSLRCPCGAVMCDYCGKDITRIGYGHFRGEGGGYGQNQGCPTHDDTTMRRREALQNADRNAIKKVQAKNPEVGLKDFDFRDDDAAGPEKSLRHERIRRDFVHNGERFPMQLLPFDPQVVGRPPFLPLPPMGLPMGPEYQHHQGFHPVLHAPPHHPGYPHPHYPAYVPPYHPYVPAPQPAFAHQHGDALTGRLPTFGEPAYPYPFQVPAHDRAAAPNKQAPNSAQQPTRPHDPTRHGARDPQEEVDKYGRTIKKFKTKDGLKTFVKVNGGHGFS